MYICVSICLDAALAIIYQNHNTINDVFRHDIPSYKSNGRICLRLRILLKVTIRRSQAGGIAGISCEMLDMNMTNLAFLDPIREINTYNNSFHLKTFMDNILDLLDHHFRTCSTRRLRNCDSSRLGSVNSHFSLPKLRKPPVSNVQTPPSGSTHIRRLKVKKCCILYLNMKEHNDLMAYSSMNIHEYP